MQLGAFSISLAVSDLARSKAFYEKLGFEAPGDTLDQNFLILKNGDTVIGLFQGMFEGSIMTFNPGWDQSAQPVDPFSDVREIKAHLTEAGIEVAEETGGEAGPGSFMVTDPDGHTILIDQHR
ncbi:MAG: VOC family protein [Pseudomonadota bacterium]